MYMGNLRRKDESWDYRTADTKEYTHCFHTYPAMMIPQIARRLLNSYGVEGEWLLDPYCGTGTSLVEASLFGMHSVGCDINPLVRLIATAKLTPISLKTLDSELKKLNDTLFQIEFGVDKLPDVPIPKIQNLEYWFSAEVIKHLAYGDSHTTVAYGQFSRLSAEWLGLPNARKVDKLAMGGHRSGGILH